MGTPSRAATERRSFGMIIAGEETESLSGRRMETINPYTGEVWATAPDADGADVDRAVAAARAALEGPWGRMGGPERARLMRRFAALLEKRGDELARIETTDNGKLLRETQGQLRAMPEWFYYFAGAADKLEGATLPGKANYLVYTRHEPLGVVGAITPWNSPLNLLSFKLAPALAAGCTMVVKSASQTPISTIEFVKLFEEAGFPPGVVNAVSGVGRTAGRALVRHPGVDKVAFTGSTETGINIMKDAAEQLSKVTLELGGKSPNIVFSDADLDAAVNGVVAGIFAASGQTCIAGSRLLVHESLHDALVERLAERAARIRLGDPADPETEMGPLAFEDQRDTVLRYVQIARDEGANVVCGGDRAGVNGSEDGLFVEPTIITGVRNDMRIAQEEVFGPVLCVIPFRTEEEAIGIANDSEYGLAAGIWTNDVRRAHRVAHALEAGTVWVNAYRVLSYEVPFGGYKMSGVGFENGFDSVKEFLRTKAVWVELSGDSRDPFRLG